MPLSLFKEAIQSSFSETENNFFINCSVAAIKLNHNPAITLTTKDNINVNEHISSIINEIEKDSTISNVFYFRDYFSNFATAPDILPRVPLPNYCHQMFPDLLPAFPKVSNQFFIFLIIEFKSNTTASAKKIKTISTAGKISKIAQRFDRKVKTYLSITPGNTTITLLALNHGIYSSYKLNSTKKKGIKNIPATFKFHEKYFVSDFIKTINQELKKFTKVHDGENNLVKMLHFINQSNREYKYLREEYTVLMQYLLNKKTPLTAEIILGTEKQPWDAKIISSELSEIIEITQAIPENEHETRKGLLSGIHGYRNLSLKLRTIQQVGMDSFPNTIIKAINSKHEKNYMEQRTLLVVVLLEFAYDEHTVVAKWIDYLNKEIDLGNFSEIYLAVDAKYFHKLHVQKLTNRCT